MFHDKKINSINLKDFIMNLIKLAIIAILLTLNLATVQADTATPNILSSVSENSMQTLNNSEANKIRGEYYSCDITGRCYIQISSKKLRNTYSENHTYLFSFKQYGFWGKKHYVAR